VFFVLFVVFVVLPNPSSCFQAVSARCFWLPDLLLRERCVSLVRRPVDVACVDVMGPCAFYLALEHRFFAAERVSCLAPTAAPGPPGDVGVNYGKLFGILFALAVVSGVVSYLTRSATKKVWNKVKKAWKECRGSPPSDPSDSPAVSLELAPLAQLSDV
jgi:hypothetical protein